MTTVIFEKEYCQLETLQMVLPGQEHDDNDTNARLQKIKRNMIKKEENFGFLNVLQSIETCDIVKGLNKVKQKWTTHQPVKKIIHGRKSAKLKAMTRRGNGCADEVLKYSKFSSVYTFSQLQNDGEAFVQQCGRKEVITVIKHTRARARTPIILDTYPISRDTRLLTQFTDLHI